MTSPPRAGSSAGAPFATTLRGALLPSALVGLGAVGVCAVVRGIGTLPSGLLGLFVALAFFGSGLALLSKLLRDSNPLTFVAVAMTIYLGQVLVLLGFLIAFRDAAWLDGMVFGAVVFVVTIAWQVFMVRAWRRARVPVYDRTEVL